MKRLLLATALCLLPAPVLAQGAHCSRETLQVRGTPVTVSFCVTADPRKAPGSQIVVPVAASYTSPRGAFDDAPTLHFIAGEGTSRVLQSVPLAKLGITGTLHLTLIYAGGVVRIESAMLTPGAITIK